jgi:FkbH-like protein
MTSLAQKILGSLARDRSLPLTELARKAVRYGAATMTAPYFLRDCDEVGARARTPYGAPIVDNRGRITIGDDAQIVSRFAPVRLATAPGATLAIGDGVTINFGCTLSAEQSVTLGHRVSLGPYVRIADHDDPDDPAPGKPQPVTLGDDVWLAARVRVLRGATIGAGTVVTAGSVVSGNLPPGVVAGGSPARVLRKRAPEDVPPPPEVPESGPVARTADARGLLVADFSIQELAAHLAREDGLGPSVTASTAPFGQVVQTLHELARAGGEDDFAVVWTRPESIASWARLARGETVSEDDILAEVDAFADLVLAAAKGVRWVFVPTWTRAPWDRGMGMRDLKPGGPGHALARMNLRLADRLEEAKNAHVLDAARWIEAAGKNAVRAKLWYLGKVGFSHAVFAEAALDVRAALRGLRGQAKKLVVLDLDDTLWGGIVGDVGWQNLHLGGHDPLGESFVAFQRCIVDLTRRGIALAIVSKNEESVALEAIRSHPEMVLKMEQVSAHRINWRDKAQNIVEIAKELNLGLQSVVFIDDNPVERARVREALPEVFVPDWPEDKLEYVPKLLSLRCFDVPRISDEDRERTKMYAQEREREGMKTTFASIDDWLLGLAIEVRFARLDASNLARTTQLLNKTNQMNTRTRRLSEAELSAWAAEPGHELWTVTVRDKFGDSGLTGILGLADVGDALEITDYVLSCRVMGRKVEETLLHQASQRALARGKARVVAPFAPTAKNKPARTFFEGSGFRWDEASASFVHEGAYPKPAAITVEGGT